MAAKFKAWTVDSSSSSSGSSEEESASYEYPAQPMVGTKLEREGNHGSNDSVNGRGKGIPQTTKSQGAAQQDASTFELPNLQPHQHSALFYLSLVEGRCKTQAMKTLNAKSASGELLSEDHPEVCELAQRLFQDISRDLSSIGMLPAEFSGTELANLRARYLTSFDQRLGSAISRYSREPQFHEPPPPHKPQAQVSRVLTEGFANLELILRGTLPSTLTSINTLAAPTIYTMPTPKPYNISADSPAGLAEMFMNLHVIGKLGGGGYGNVYMASQHVDGRNYAVKVVPLNSNALTREELILTSAEARKAIEEVVAISKLSHDNIVPYHWTWLHRGKETETHLVRGSTTGANKKPKTIASGFLLENATISDQSEQSLFERQGDKTDEERTSVTASDQSSGDLFERGTGKSGKERSVTASDQSAGDLFEQGTEKSGKERSVIASDQSAGDFFERGTDLSEQDSAEREIHEKSQEYRNLGASSDSSDKSDSSSAGEHSMPIETDCAHLGKKDIMKHKKNWHLYIAMALCDASLSKYLSSDPPSRAESFQYRHCFHKRASVQMLHKILDGLSYIHRNDMVHRDLKPANILISINRDKGRDSYTSCIMVTDCKDCKCLCSSEKACSNSEGCSPRPVYLIPRIADFGLQAKIEPSEDPNGEEKEALVARNTDVPPGTKHYTAPHIKVPNTKQDIYSLGIVAFELMYKFHSQSERHTVLSMVNNHQFPEDFNDEKWKEGVVGMTTQDIEKQWDLARVRDWLVEIEKDEMRERERQEVKVEEEE